MEGRVRLAQSLKRRSSFVLWPRLNDWRAMRIARRWGHAGRPERPARTWFVGRRAAAAWKCQPWRRQRRTRAPDRRECPQYLRHSRQQARIRISEIAPVSASSGRDEILVLAGITDHSSLLFLDAARTRARLMMNPWVADATVRRLYPDRLRIEIKEREAFALCKKTGA